MNVAAEITTKNIRRSSFSPSVTIAQNEAGETIRGLVKDNGFFYEADWSDIYPYWLIATHEGEIVGCLQVLPGKPIGRIEMLATKTSLDKLKRANIAWRLYVTAVSMLRTQGSQVASSIVLFNNKGVKRSLKKRGANVEGQGNIMMMEIADDS